MKEKSIISNCIFRRFVITSDRDEKIRVTHYPRTEIIETYCMGHLEFVSSIEVITSNATQSLLLSLSGDKTLRLWNYVTGTELVQSQLPAPGLKMIVNARNQVAIVVLEKPLKIVFAELISFKNGEWEIQLTGEFLFGENIKYVNSLIYENDDVILAACHTDDDGILLKQLSRTKDNTFVEIELPTSLAKALPTTKIDLLEDVSILFKKKFDNVADYHERKKRRMEKKFKSKYQKSK